MLDMDCNHEDVCCNNLISLAFFPLSLNYKSDHSTDRCLNIVITNVNDDDIIRNLNVYLASKGHRSIQFQLIWNWQKLHGMLYFKEGIYYGQSLSHIECLHWKNNGIYTESCKVTFHYVVFLIYREWIL